jgi:hypothetical protein
MTGFGLFEHALIALALQALIGFASGRWWVGAALTSGYFIGREVAQAEYRWIERFGEGLRANLPWDAVFDPRVWQTADQTADWLGPLVATVTAALLVSRRRKARGPGGEDAHRP